MKKIQINRNKTQNIYTSKKFTITLYIANYVNFRFEHIQSCSTVGYDEYTMVYSSGVYHRKKLIQSVSTNWHWQVDPISWENSIIYCQSTAKSQHLFKLYSPNNLSPKSRIIGPIFCYFVHFYRTYFVTSMCDTWSFILSVDHITFPAV